MDQLHQFLEYLAGIKYYEESVRKFKENSIYDKVINELEDRKTVFISSIPISSSPNPNKMLTLRYCLQAMNPKLLFSQKKFSLIQEYDENSFPDKQIHVTELYQSKNLDESKKNDV
jgi:hypothetical protein